MKLTAETPPNGDFVRYLEEIERDSPAWQSFQSTLAAQTPGAVASKAADRPGAVATAPAQPKRDDPLASLKRSPLLRQPAVQALAGPLLQRLEQALAAARDAQARHPVSNLRPPAKKSRTNHE